MLSTLSTKVVLRACVWMDFTYENEMVNRRKIIDEVHWECRGIH
jgi:hypothetical protein